MEAEDFIREKIREKLEIKGVMNSLWTYGCNGEDALRWAHEFAQLKLSEVKNIELMSEIEKVIKGIDELITDTVITENEGSRRCLTNVDLNVFEDWVKLLKQANEPTKQPDTKVLSVARRYCTACGKECEKDTPFGFALCDEHNTELSESFDTVNKDREEFTPEV